MSHPAGEQHRRDIARIAPKMAQAIRQVLESQKASVGRAQTPLAVPSAKVTKTKLAVLPAILTAVGTGAARVGAVVGTKPEPNTDLAGALAYKFATQFTATTQKQLDEQAPTEDPGDVLAARIALADVIAATVISNALNGGAQNCATSLPAHEVLDKTWVVTDSHPCVECAGVDGDTVPGNKRFANGAPHGPIHSGCTCTVAWSRPPSTSPRSRRMAKYDTAQLKAMLKKGEAFPNPNGDPSFPIGDVEDLNNAIHAVGRAAGDHDAVRKYIIGRAKTLGKSTLIPDNWNADGSIKGANSAAPTGEVRDKPTDEDSQVASILNQTKVDIARAKAAQLSDPDNGSDPDDEAVMAQIVAMEAAVDKALAAQSKDGHDDKKEKKSAVPAVPKRVFQSLTERPVPVANIEVRMGDSNDDASAQFVGYASTTGTGYAVHDWLGEYRETIAPGAFAKTLREQTDVPLLFNHDGFPLASTASGTSRLSEDANGLRNEAVLDRSDGNTNTVCVQLRRGVLNKMSFSFRAIQDTWNDTYDDRSVREVALYDTSIVTYPANPATTADLRSAYADVLGRDGVGVMWSLREAFRASPVNVRALTEEAEPIVEKAIRALALADDVVCRRTEGPHARARTFLVAGLMEQVRKGAVLSAENAALLGKAMDALTQMADNHAASQSKSTKHGGTKPAGANQDGATGGSNSSGNPVMPADGAGPRSAPPVSVVQTEALVAALRSGKR
ncbi:MAG: HK97 family phage prohead protease [Acidimicrobiales bacterium]